MIGEPGADRGVGHVIHRLLCTLFQRLGIGPIRMGDDKASDLVEAAAAADDRVPLQRLGRELVVRLASLCPRRFPIALFGGGERGLV
jgi:hypothetical protein